MAHWKQNALSLYLEWNMGVSIQVSLVSITNMHAYKKFVKDDKKIIYEIS